jgi:hypothetical protein
LQFPPFVLSVAFQFDRGEQISASSEHMAVKPIPQANWSGKQQRDRSDNRFAPAIIERVVSYNQQRDQASSGVEATGLLL